LGFPPFVIYLWRGFSGFRAAFCLSFCKGLRRGSSQCTPSLPISLPFSTSLHQPDSLFGGFSRRAFFHSHLVCSFSCLFFFFQTFPAWRFFFPPPVHSLVMFLDLGSLASLCMVCFCVPVPVRDSFFFRLACVMRIFGSCPV